ncbi:ethanolamine utilization protein EutJ [Desulfospira joergensenii]|uniref:ethanolamine utilization protein EutJ n=1 Tax=Desulfospira joergensenii TaxID=53329 RepID=UPI0003B3D1DC|nr:ethanolamine utilization protein EutJ [Desulfospira joergensenii]
MILPVSWNIVEARLEKAMGILNDETPMAFEGPFHVGIDLGTSDVVLMVLDGSGEPVAVFLEWAEVVRDGVVVDFLGANDIVFRLKEKAEKKLNISITGASTSFPPGTDPRLSTNILENQLIEVLHASDEPSCVARLLHLDKTAVVDVGGGTTGTAVVQKGNVVFSDDEATGGTHISLVIAGHFGISVEEAEKRKRKSEEYGILALATPTFQRICHIVSCHIQNQEIDQFIFSGGTCSLPGLSRLFEKELGRKILIPKHPILLTPLAIAALGFS